MERKSGFGSRALQEAVVAFSNSEGGVVLIGVDDDGRVLGKQLTQGMEESIHQAVATIRNPGRYEINQLLIDETPVVVLSVERRVQGFAQTASGRVLVRRGAMNVALFDAELFEFISSRALERFELEDSGVSRADADAALVAEVAGALDWTEDSEIDERLREQGLLLPAADRLTVAGALYLLQRPEGVLAKAFIELRRYPDSESVDPDKRTEVCGPIHHQVAEATEQVMQELGSEVVVLGLRRHDLPRLPRVVVREALANAVVHRSYESSGTAIRVDLRPGAVTVCSPGSLPAPVTVDNIRDAQSSRNPRLIALMRRFRLAEDAGRGVDVMQDSMMEELLDPPAFADSGHSVEVALPVRGGVTTAERAWVREIEARGEIEPVDRILLVHAARGEELTNARVREIAHVDRFAATQALRRLRDTGFLSQRGKRGGAVYELRGGLEPPAGLRLDRSELKDLVYEMASEQSLQNADVRARTGLDRLDALTLLNELVAEGRLARVGQRRGSRYVRVDGDLG
ncbi:MAG TPA: ATP-binding protein [Solirubrobacterales bacterium]|nr:ATP-binding protein [Solirubrobacterales bacterium]